MTQTFLFRAPGAAHAAQQLLTWAFPGLAPELRARWLAERRLRSGDVRVHDPDDVIAPGSLLELEVEAPLPTCDAWPSLRLLGAEAFACVPTPAWRRGRVAVGDMPSKPDATPSKTGETPSQSRGGLPPKCEIVFECVREWDDVSELRLSLEGLAELGPATSDLAFRRARQVLDVLARAGLVVLGDVWNGGRIVGPGVAWRNADAEGDVGAEAEPAGLQAPVFVSHDQAQDHAHAHSPSRSKSGREGGLPRWTVSEATARVLARGHPWILPDAQSEPPDRFRPGERVEVVSVDGRAQGQALIDGGGAVAGRRVSRPGETGWSVEACVARALKRRRDFLGETGRTDAFRLVHGEADGLPGLFVDRLGPLVRVLVTARCGQALVDRALQALAPAIPQPWRIVEVLHLDERNRFGQSVQGRFERVRVHPWSMDAEGARALGTRAEVREAGLVYAISPGLEEPERSAPGYGLFLDQRENRARFAKRARGGGRYLNLFAHTGAFSVALLAAGADSVESVDLSGAYLRWLEENLALNRASGVDPTRHVSIRQDGRRHLERLAPEERFDGIVLDPPTAAAAGRQFFSVRRDLLPMVSRCLSALAPGGLLLLTLNDRKARRRLEDLVDEAALAAGVALASTKPALPARDFPRLDGFAEGDAFRGLWIERAS